MKAKGKILGFPFLGFKGYKIWHSKQGRYYVCLVPLRDGLKRTTITFAKYRLSRYLGRRLKKHEEVDHKDGDRTNDRVRNLQILSGIDNRRKSIIEQGKSSVYLKLKCPMCSAIFYRAPNKVNWKIAQGFKPTCSRQCGRLSAALKNLK